MLPAGTGAAKHRADTTNVIPTVVTYVAMSSPDAEDPRVVCTFRTGRGSLTYLTREAKRLGINRSDLIRRMLQYAALYMPELNPKEKS